MGILKMNQVDVHTLLTQLKEQDIKIQISGEQLRVNSTNNSLTPTLADLIRSNKEAIMYYLSEGGADETIQHDTENRYQPFPLNENQQAYWFGRSDALDGGGVAIHLYFEIDASNIDIDRLESAWGKLVERHDMLRAVVTANGQQRVLEHVKASPFTRHSLPLDNEDFFMSVRGSLSHKNYDLTQWPQHEFHVVSSPSTKTLCLSIDCWSIDGWSYQILFQEWWHLYQNNDQLTPLNLTFRDYQVHQSEADLSKEQQDYIHTVAANLPPAPSIPVNSSSDGHPVFKRHQHWVTHKQTAGLKSWCSNNGVTVASTLMTLYAEVLHLWSNDERFTINVPRFNRNSDDSRIKNIVGEFATFSLVPFDFTPSVSRLSRVRQAQKEVLESMDIGVSGVTILRERNRIMNSVQLMPYVFTNAPEWVKDNGEKQSFIDTLQLFGSLKYAISQTPQVSIDCQYHENSQGLYVFWDVRQDQFYPQQAEQMFNAYIAAIEALIDDELTETLTVPCGEMVETEKFVTRSVWEDYLSTVDNYPQQKAITCSNGELSWHTLSLRVNALAARLSQQIDSPQQSILLLAEKGWSQVAGFLAIFSQGHTIVPVDPSNPIERLRFIASDTESPLVLCSCDQRKKAESLGIEYVVIDEKELNEPAEVKLSHDTAMIIIYTSGSTGQPKGVQISQSAISNSVNVTIERFTLNDSDTLLGLTQLHHDMSWFDILASIKTGAKLVYPPANDYRNPAVWADLICQYKITFWNSVPQLMQMLLTYLTSAKQVLPSLRVAFLGGDWIPLSVYSSMQDYLPNATLVSVGGPTETTLWNIMFEVNQFDNAWKSIPYGWPIDNNHYRIFDTSGRDCPPWVEGEMCCTGIGVTQGYIKRNELEQEKFFIAKDGQRYYRTGDIGRFKPDGCIEFIGRKDDQIMVGGYRIESQEIHQALEKIQSIYQAQVIIHDGVLQAYIVTQGDHELAVDKLQKSLEKVLPSQVIPSLFFIVEHIPLTGNGKVDAKALLQSGVIPMDKSQVLAQPIVEQEHQRIAELWHCVLERKPTSLNDDFFLYGGNSLSAVRLFALMFPHGHDEFSVVNLFECRTVQAQAEILCCQSDTQFNLLCLHKHWAPLSQAQQRICFVEQLTTEKALFNLPFRIRISATSDPDRLLASLNQVLHYHDVFQSVLKEGCWLRNLAIQSAYFHNETMSEEQIGMFSKKQAGKTFVLGDTPGWEAILVKHTQGHYELLFTIHHALFDGWSLQLLLNEWQGFYTSTDENKLSNNAPGYFDYCHWENQQPPSEQSIQYWRENLSGYETSFLMPTQPNPDFLTHRAGTVSLTLNAELTDAVHQLAESLTTTDFAVMMAAYQLLISRYLSQNDVVIGTHVANRKTAVTQVIPGLFLNNLVIRQTCQKNWTVDTFIQAQTEVILSAMKHADLPFEKVVSELDHRENNHRHPVYQASFVLDNSQVIDGELEFAIERTEQVAISTDLEMNVQLCESGAHLNLVYREGLFTSTSMQRLLQQYQTLLLQFVSSPNSILGNLNYNCAEDEVVQRGETVDLSDLNLLTLWRKVVEHSPQALAYIDEENSLTFSQLDQRAQNFALHLQDAGIESSSRVGLHLGLGKDLLVALIALQKLSACYVPLDLNLPQNRLKKMIEIAACDLVIGQTPLHDIICTYQEVNEWLNVPAPLGTTISIPEMDSSRLLYITFTSGSTGTPKAVASTEHASLNRFMWTWTECPYQNEEVCGWKTSISFVDSIAEMFMPLLKGKALALIPTLAQYAPDTMSSLIEKHRITRLVMVPSLMETLVEYCENNPESTLQLKQLKHLTLSGETLPPILADKIFTLWPAITLWNIYGSAEVAADVLASRITPDHTLITVGRPFLNTIVKVQDNWGGVTPWGGKGELMVSGSQVISGYLNETAFPKDEEGMPCFKTGDFVRFNDQGEVVFIGREQQQVKIRGQKVSLVEIKETLAQVEGVCHIAVVLLDEQRIGVMYCPNNVEISELERVASQFLPRYMRPQVYAPVEKLPLLATGKVDLNAVRTQLIELPLMMPSARNLTIKESDIADIWEQLTGISPSVPEQHFFEVGGHSLLVNSLTNQLNRAYQLSLNISLVYESLILSEMALLVETLTASIGEKVAIKEKGII